MRQIVVMPGGFHPFHAGHASLYQSAIKAFPGADVYVAATNDTKTRPFPFKIKEKLAKVAGVAPGHFVQVKSPFKAEEITSHYNPNEDVLIFVRSEKDKNEQPKPGGTKKDGTSAYFQPWTGKDLQPFSQHAYMAYLPTVEFGPGITSATEIRNAWPKLNDKRKTAMVMSLYPATQKNPKLAANVVQLLDMGMGNELAEGWKDTFAAGMRGAKAAYNKSKADRLAPRKETHPAYDEGFKAGSTGWERDDNPYYETGKSAEFAWDRGWKASKNNNPNGKVSESLSEYIPLMTLVGLVYAWIKYNSRNEIDFKSISGFDYTDASSNILKDVLIQVPKDEFGYPESYSVDFSWDETQYDDLFRQYAVKYFISKYGNVSARSIVKDNAFMDQLIDALREDLTLAIKNIQQKYKQGVTKPIGRIEPTMNNEPIREPSKSDNIPQSSKPKMSDLPVSVRHTAKNNRNLDENVNQGVAEEFRPSTSQAMNIQRQTRQKMNPGASKFVWKRPNQISGSNTENELKSLNFKYSAKYNMWGGTQQMWDQLTGKVNEFAPPSSDRGDGGDSRSRRIRKLLEIAIQVAKEKNVDELGMIHGMNMIAGDDFFNTAVQGILPDITDKEYMFVLQSAYKTVKQGLAEAKKKRKKKSRNRSLGRYFFPGYSYYGGGGESGEGGGDGGGEGVNEFAPNGGDDREPNEEILRKLAAQWWNGTEQQMRQAQQTLHSMGWDIGQDESGDDDAGVFVIRIGDEHGNSYIAFPHSDLGLNEDYLDEK